MASTNADYYRRTFTGYSNSEHIEIQPDTGTPFCSYISSQFEGGPSLLYLTVAGEKLYYEDFGDSATQWEIDKPSISLAQLLEEILHSDTDMTEKRKEVLSWLLSKAVWQYYRTPWMTQPWNKEMVHFLSERRPNEAMGIFINEPLLSVSIAPSRPGSGKPCVGGKVVTRLPPPFRLRHKIPKILGLGVMLLEIQLGRPIESLYGEDEWIKYCPGGKPNLNTNYNIAKDLIARQGFFEHISDPLEALIRNCIEPRSAFVPPYVRDEDGIREALYVFTSRLEVYLSWGKPHNVKPLSLTRFSTPSRSLLTTPTPHLPNRHSPHMEIIHSQSSSLPVNIGVKQRPGRTMAIM